MTWEKFWSIIDRVRAQADMQDEASVKQFLYTELIKLPQDELLGFDCVWQSYRNKANFPKMVAAACIINDGSSDDRFTDFRNWLIMQGYDAYRQALIGPDNLAALNIPFRDTEWMGCGNVAWYAYAGQKLHTYFEKEGIAAKLFRKYPALLKSSADLHQAIMQEQLAPCRAPETEWERQMLRTEVKHYIDTSGLAYSYNEFYTQNMPDKVAWKTLQSDLFANLPQIKAERIPQLSGRHDLHPTHPDAVPSSRPHTQRTLACAGALSYGRVCEHFLAERHLFVSAGNHAFPRNFLFHHRAEHGTVKGYVQG